MSIEIISLTQKGRDLAHSRNSGTNQKELWATLYFISRQGGRVSNDKVVNYVFGGDERSANKAIGELKFKGILIGE